MDLYLKEPFSWGRSLPLLEPDGRTRYLVFGDAFRLGKRLYVRDLAQRDMFYARQIIPAVLPAFSLEVYGKPIGDLVRSRTEDSYRLESLSWTVTGTRRAGCAIRQGQRVIADCAPDPEGLHLRILTPERDKAALGVLLTAYCMELFRS